MISITKCGSLNLNTVVSRPIKNLNWRATTYLERIDTFLISVLIQI